MATALTGQKTTPHSASFLLTSDNGAQTAYDYTASMTGFFARGPLRTLLGRLNAAGALDTLNTNGSRSRLVRIRRIEGSTVVQTSPATKTVVWTANGLTVAAAAGSVSQIEIRLADSPER